MIGLLFLSAILKGAGPEKAAASTFVAMAVIDRLYHLITGEGSLRTDADLAHAAIDVFACISLGYIALYANRNYTLWLAGFQIVATIAHLARGLADQISPIAYVMMYIGPSYFQIIILAFGIWLHHRRVKRHGTYREWRTSSPRSQERQHPH